MMHPEFDNKKQQSKWLSDNKQKLMDQKKMQIKHADALFIPTGVSKSHAIKSTPHNNNPNELSVKVVINTTNIMDSHSDVHVKGIWDKSLQERKHFYLLQEHKNTFDGVISSDVRAYVQEKTFKEMGFDLEGDTQLLVFEAKLKQEDNPAMFKRYKEGKVREHSVGMHYVKLAMAINDDEYGAEYEVWEKYYSLIANKELAERKGYFWVIKEAKLLEGSAVLMGSNSVTPTLEVKTQVKNDISSEPLVNTRKSINEEPPKGTLIDEHFKEYLKEQFKN